MEKRILVISWFYPPVNSSEGLVTYKLIKASKFKYDVFTQKNNVLWSYGKKNNVLKSDNVNSIYAKAVTLQEWINEAVEYFKANKDKYDIVMTRSMPPESHKIGLEIKKIKPSIKWIASFGDPIAENPYVKLSMSYTSPHDRINCTSFKGIISPKRIIRNAIFKRRYNKQMKYTLKKDFKLQNLTIRTADCIIFNSIYQKDYMLNKYENSINDKVLVLNHSFDESLYPLNKEKNNKIVMSYVGHLDNLRSPYLLFQAINELSKEDDKLAEKINLRFYGNMADRDKLYVIDNELTDIIKIKKPVSYLESLSIMKNSDWLLQIDANISEVNDKNIFFAAKLADYIGSQSKIFGITMLDGISADILRDLNMLSVSYSVQEIKNYLWLIIYKNYDININMESRKKFDSINVAKIFDEYVEKF